MIQGIAEFARIQERWRIFGLFDRPAASPQHVTADGAIIYLNDFGLLEAHVPRVYVGTRRTPYPPGAVHSDNEQIGRMRAEHLLECGLRYFQSSQLMAIDDPEIASAVRFIHDHYLEPISVKDVLKVVPVSRQLLDNRFRRRVGRSMHSEIKRLRIRRACELLARTNLTIPQVAANCGFGGREYFTTAFTRATGLSPGGYRRQVLGSTHP